MPLHELLFAIEHSLCKEYPALTPFDIEKESYYKVMDLFADTRKLQIRDKKETDPTRTIRRPAGDNWF